MRINIFTTATLALLGLSSAVNANEIQINTGAETGAYYSSFCPVLKERLGKAGLNATCKTSNGTAENMSRVTADPKQLGYGQLDVLALNSGTTTTPEAYIYLRNDDVRECLFAVTRAKHITNFGELAINASKLRFFLPPMTSGSANTFRLLQQIDPYGIGQGTKIVHEANTEQAIRQALKTDNGVTLFVQFPDPDNEHFKLIKKLGGHIVPVIDRRILARKLGNKNIYYAQETQVENARWLKTGTKIVTACTPLILFTGLPQLISNKADRTAHQNALETVRHMSADALLPNTSLFARVLKRTRELSAAGAKKFIDLSEKAREKAAPLLEKAKQAAKKAMEPAAPVQDPIKPAP